MARPPLTPDFAHYQDGLPITAVADDESFVTITWAGGLVHRFHHLFLAESSVGEGVIDAVTRERLVDVNAIDPDVRPVRVTVDADGHLSIEWTPPTPVATARFHKGWLRAVATGAWRVDHDIPAPVPWNATIMPALPMFDGRGVLTDDRVLKTLLETLCRTGVAHLHSLPTDDETVARVATRIGVIRETSFGRLFEVRSKPDPNSIAYTAHALAPHTDLPTRELPPGFQLLHCRTNTCTDGHSVIVDGYAVAEMLRQDNRAAFDNLVRVDWVHTNRSPDYDYRWSAPILDVDQTGRVSEVRLLNGLRTMPDVADADIAAAYAALRAFTALSIQPALVLRTLLAPGDLLIFDNRRILHGRDSFDATAGDRHLQGCYVDRDDVHSRLRILARL